MCNGLASSAIRSRREKLSALPRLYSDEVLGSLRKYLPHLKHAKFLGGEPFLVEEHFALWQMLIDDSLKVPCHVTANGTQYNSRIECTLDSLLMSFSVSLDGVSKRTVESIRANAKFEVILENLLRFRNYTRARRTSLSLTFCLMRQNWEEFGDFCLFADAWDCPVGVNTVLHPPEFGIYTLPVAELRKVVAKMERQAPELESQLRRNRSVWFGELDRLQRKCDSSEPQLPTRTSGG